MQTSRATIQQAKVSGSEHGRESTLTLTLDVKLPTPVAVQGINEWAATELDWQTRQAIGKAQQARKATKKKLTKKEVKTQQQAHEQGIECSLAGCENCYPDSGVESLVCLDHTLPWQECQACDGEGAIFLDPEDVTTLRGQYERYAQERTALNREALMAAQEAALFLLLLKKPVQVSIAPAQQAFADLLQLAAPNA